MADFEFKIRTTDLPGARNELGQFQSAASIMAARNRNLAEVLATRVVIAQTDAINAGGRAQASRGRLRRVTLDPKNRSSNNSNIYVGNPTFLDNSIAKYWRTFEQGSAGLWRRPFMGTQVRFIGGRRTGSSFTPSYHNQSPGIRTAKNIRFGEKGLGRVKNEIEGAFAYRKAMEGGEPQEQFLQHSRQYVRNLVNGLLGPPAR